MNTCFSDIDLTATGFRIKAARKSKGLKVTDISSYMGFESPQAVYKWQRGECLPDLGNMMRLLMLLEITDIRDLVVMTDDEKSNCTKTNGSADEALPFVSYLFGFILGHFFFHRFNSLLRNQ